eukprot:scaffold5980_cov376-Prasinococcus_capsulatus_cf.AAC.9
MPSSASLALKHQRGHGEPPLDGPAVMALSAIRTLSRATMLMREVQEKLGGVLKRRCWEP